jgi:hypothetical protein
MIPVERVSPRGSWVYDSLGTRGFHLGQYAAVELCIELHGREHLVKVFDTEQESEAMVVQGLLESEEIDSLITYLDAPQDVLPGVGGVIVQVREEQAERARKIIAESRSDAAAAKADLTEEPEPTEPAG